jgi:hypothetical protein
LREWQSGERGTAPFIPLKAAGTCQDPQNRFAFSVRSQDEGAGGAPARLLLASQFLSSYFSNWVMIIDPPSIVAIHQLSQDWMIPFQQLPQ